MKSKPQRICFKTMPTIAATKISTGSFTFLTFNNIRAEVIAITAVGTSWLVLVLIIITEPARAPTTAAVIPSTNAFKLGC